MSRDNSEGVDSTTTKKEGGDDDEEHKVKVGDEVHTLSMHDVLCGRGSGPNDHPGNVNFRKLIISRKAEYLSTTARAEKARIAQEIVEHVQQDLDPRGRFLKKMGPAELNEKKYEPGQDVWVIVDQDTALEKAKQALRQNRDKPLVEEQLRQKKAEAEKADEEVQKQVKASLASASADSATRSSVTGSVTSSVATSSISNTRRSSALAEDPNRSSSVKSAEARVHSTVASAATNIPHDALPGGGCNPPGTGSAVPYPHGHPAAIQYSGYPAAMPPETVHHPAALSPCAPVGYESQPTMYPGQYAYQHPQYGQVPPQQRMSSEGGDDTAQSFRVSDLVHEFQSMGPTAPSSRDEKGSPVTQEHFPYAFGDPGHGSSNITMGSEFSPVSESDLLAANLEPIPIPTGSEPVIEGEVPEPMSSGTLSMVQKLAQDDGGGSRNGNDKDVANNEQVDRQQAYQEQQYQRHPGHQYTQQYYYKTAERQTQGMQGSGRANSTRSDMSKSMSLSEITGETTGHNVTANRQATTASCETGMQGIIEGAADDERSENEQGVAASPEPMFSSDDKISAGSSGKMSGMSSGSGMAASVSSSTDKPSPAAALRPIELIQEEPDNLSCMGASSSSMMKAVFDTSSGSNFSQLSKMSILMSGDESGSSETKKPASKS
mmetsp:Transcript_9347/g.19862  ORF Transcript_9347/g.19862 Transcript_9347/m.19862 type:complete len:661 (+) Transcript_9347:323-2305(+)